MNNSDLDLNYVGPVPDFRYFNDISLQQYTEYSKNFTKNWYLKYETKKYCLQDCVSLYQVIKKFSYMIYKELNVNLRFAPTTSSLALRTYRTKFKDATGIKFIPIITGETYKFIKQSFTGGHVDVYNPYGKEVYHYDVNSLYPYIMKTYPMGVGNPTYFEGNIIEHKHKPHGFFSEAEVEITTPDNLFIPIIQTRIMTKDGFLNYEEL